MSALLLIISVVTMVVGILGALAQPGIKRMLSFTLVSHIGYLLYGVGLGSAAGVSASVFYVAHHILVQTSLFLAAGLIERVAGTTLLSRLGGLAVGVPVLAVLFFIPAMNLAGVPPFSGFLGKVGLIQAGIDDGSVLALVGVAGGILTSLLTLLTIVRVWGSAFWRSTPTEPGPGKSTARSVKPVAGTAIAVRSVRTIKPLPRGMLGATAATVLVSLILTFFGGPIYALASRAGDDLMHPERYVSAVFANQGVGVDPQQNLEGSR